MTDDITVVILNIVIWTMVFHELGWVNAII